MICKEDICCVFRDLRSAERIDLLCTVLQLCVPLELRFIGSCLEELARKDYSSLLEYELRANDPSALNNLKQIIPTVLKERKTYAMLNVYLSLLHSDNAECANVLFDILASLERTVETDGEIDKSLSPSDDCRISPVTSAVSGLIDDLLLLFTLAAYHPAFTFCQRQRLFDMYSNVEKQLKCSSSFMHNSGISGISLLDDAVNSPSCDSPSLSAAESSSAFTFPKTVKVKNCEFIPSSKIHTYCLEVVWSDGCITEVVKSYSELHSFHTELLRLFPKDSGAQKQERSIPFIPQASPGSKTCREKLSEQMNEYFRKLSSVPDYIARCEHLSSFFQRPSSNQSPSNVSLSPSDEYPSSAVMTITRTLPLVSTIQLANDQLVISSDDISVWSPVVTSHDVSMTTGASSVCQQQVPCTIDNESLLACSAQVFRSATSIATGHNQHSVASPLQICMSSSTPNLIKPVRPFITKSSSLYMLPNGLSASAMTVDNKLLPPFSGLSGSIAQTGVFDEQSHRSSLQSCASELYNNCTTNLQEMYTERNDNVDSNEVNFSNELSSEHLVPEVLSDPAVALSRMYSSVNLNSCVKPTQQEPVIISQVSRPVGIAINLTQVPGTIPVDGVQGSVEMPRCAVAVTFTSSSDLCMQPAASAHSNGIPSVPVNSYSNVNSCQFNVDQDHGLDAAALPAITLPSELALTSSVPLIMSASAAPVKPLPMPSFCSPDANACNSPTVMNENYSNGHLVHVDSFIQPSAIAVTVVKDSFATNSVVVSNTSLTTTRITPRPILGSSAHTHQLSTVVAENSSTSTSFSENGVVHAALQIAPDISQTAIYYVNGVDTVSPPQPIINGIMPAGVLDAVCPPIVNEFNTAYHSDSSVRPFSTGSTASSSSSAESASALPGAYMNSVDDSVTSDLCDQSVTEQAFAPAAVLSSTVNHMAGPAASPDCVAPGANGCCQCSNCSQAAVISSSAMQSVPVPIGTITAAYSYVPVFLPGAQPCFSPGFGLSYVPGLTFPPPLGPVHVNNGYTQPTPSDIVYGNPALFTVVQPKRPPLHPPRHPHRPSLVQIFPGPLPPGNGMTLPPPLLPPRGASAVPRPILPVPFNPSIPPPNHLISVDRIVANPTSLKRYSNKKHSCFNCGNSGHLANWCPEPKINSSTQQNKYRVNYVPKSVKVDEAYHSTP